MKKLVLAIIALILPICTPVLAQADSTAEQPVTILISIDGFRPDYLDRGITPTMSVLAAEGTRARMRASFPTKTFPNHYTIVTGKRPDHHGIVGNSMIDPRRPTVRFSLGDARQSLDPFWWNEAEPIWVTAEAQGIRTATMFWPGSEVAIQGKRPKDWLRFDQNIPNDQRTRTVVDWMRRPEDSRPKLITLYFDTVDTAGHRFGPDAAETNAEIAAVDAEIGMMLAAASKLGVPYQLVIVADHGMMETSDTRTVQLDELLPRDLYIAVETGPYAAIEPAVGTDNLVYDALLKEHAHMDCYRREDLPKRLEYGTNARVAAIICIADAGYTILAGPPQYPVNGGAHGYDNLVPEMDAIFIFWSPQWTAKPATVATFDNVEVYAFLAALIGMTPLPNDGKGELVPQLLR